MFTCPVYEHHEIGWKRCEQTFADDDSFLRHLEDAHSLRNICAALMEELKGYKVSSTPIVNNPN